MTEEQDLAGRVIVVTGASRGIGYFTAIEAANRGAHVIAIARTVGGLEDLDDEIQAAGGSATLVPMDLMDGDAIDRMGRAIFERWGKLDALIGNAGMLGSITPVSHLDPKEVDKVFKLNVTANFRLIRSLEPLLKQSDAGRVLFVSSSSAYSCKPYWGLYAATKAALNAMAKSYAGEHANTPLNINVVNPGPTRTQMRAKAVPGENPDTLPHPREIAPKFVDLITPSYTENGQFIDLKNNGETSPL
ncbi:SDR family NAD(P)-dependent oxidoreductase [Maritalea mediterranea]|uniref:SDR family NAD(P)-dependent oxidoreductase n=1 Tax=Maritalea mediterranea TaxID=2909667 RepID=A0ABS9E5D6_9HYPH|nr:SDR family NAD(P)-dependent oxidoreductase [Maritalea mediterranea]MCF4098074.1 SDR family NAD(P)-dependent oxidoreductase [Maritalea mediterranea]